MVWIELKESTEEEIWTGSVFRCKGTYPHEDGVDFMVVDYDSSDSGFALIVSTGYKAGHVLIQLPEEAMCLDKTKKAISKNWLLQNWRKWIYENGPEGVLFASNYSAQNS